jgi:hypothetical protein
MVLLTWSKPRQRLLSTVLLTWIKVRRWRQPRCPSSSTSQSRCGTAVSRRGKGCCRHWMR